MSDDAPQPRTPTPGHGADLMSTPSLLALAVVAFAVELALFGGVGAIAYEVVGGGLAGWLGGGRRDGRHPRVLGGVHGTQGQAAAGHRRRAWWCRRCCASSPPTGWSRVGYPWWGWFVGIAGIAVVAAQVALPQAGPEAR